MTIEVAREGSVMTIEVAREGADNSRVFPCDLIYMAFTDFY